MNASPIRWNLFVRELEDILSGPKHSASVKQLRYQANIHQMKVRRLLQSLERPMSFPTLNPDELDRVIKHYGLDDDEQLRLRAAIIATAIEAMLMDRLDNNLRALQAAEQLLSSLVAALKEHAGELNGIGAFRGRNSMMSFAGGGETELDQALEPALDALDRATLALHLSRNVSTAGERFDRVRQARDAFQVALDELSDLAARNGAYSQHLAWLDWYQEAEQGYHNACERLTDLGG